MATKSASQSGGKAPATSVKKTVAKSPTKAVAKSPAKSATKGATKSPTKSANQSATKAVAVLPKINATVRNTSNRFQAKRLAQHAAQLAQDKKIADYTSRMQQGADVIKEAFRDSYDVLEGLRPNQRKFLAAYARTCNISRAAEIAGICHPLHWLWLRKDVKYAAAFDAIKPIAVQSLEDEAMRRAKDGVLRPVVSAGKFVCEELVYSDNLMMRLLSRHNPEFKENPANAVTGNIQVNVVLASLDDPKNL